MCAIVALPRQLHLHEPLPSLGARFFKVLLIYTITQQFNTINKPPNLLIQMMMKYMHISLDRIIYALMPSGFVVVEASNFTVGTEFEESSTNICDGCI